jgi:hypothetical protein
MPTRSLPRVAAVVVGAAAIAAAAPAAANAATVTLNGGSTTLKLTAGTARALDSLGVTAAPAASARAVGGGIRFPVTGGRTDPATGLGTIRHSGGLRLSEAGARVTLSSPTIVAGKSSSMSVRVAGKRARLLIPVLSKAKVTRSGLQTTVSGVRIHLSPAGAKALNATFGVSAFRSRQLIGTATVRERTAQVAFKGGQTSLALDAGAAAALTSLGVTPGVVGPAVANPDGSLGFPITGGAVNAKSLAGTITHSGGISLTKGATSVALTDFTIDTARQRLVATVGGKRVAILSLDLSAPAVSAAGGVTTVGNVGASLTADAAAALNQAFGTTAFAAGLKLGVAPVKGETA